MIRITEGIIFCRLSKWLEVTKHLPKTKRAKICSLHFRDSHFKVISTFKKILNEDAVPDTTLLNWNIHKPPAGAEQHFQHESTLLSPLSAVSFLSPTSPHLNRSTIIRKYGSKSKKQLFVNPPMSAVDSTISESHLDEVFERADTSGVEGSSVSQTPTKRKRTFSGINSPSCSNWALNPQEDERQKSPVAESRQVAKRRRVGSVSSPGQNIFKVTESPRAGMQQNLINVEISNPVQNSTKSSEKVLKQNEKLKQQLTKSRKLVAKLRMRLSRAREKKSAAASLEAGCRRTFKPVMHHLLDAQIKLGGCKKKGMRWSSNMKDFALSILYHGSKTYKFLKTVLPLPSISTLNRHQQDLKLKPGIHEHVEAFFMENVGKWSTSKKLCCLMIDEMSMMQNLEYDRISDQVLGYVDDGISRKKQAANQVVVAAIKGITHPWRQILGHWFSSDRGKTHMLHEIVGQCLAMLNKVGLKVKVFICDQGPKNRKLARQFGITPDKPHFQNEGETIYFMYDPPHLIKSLRNNLMKKDLIWRKHPAKWAHIKSLYTQQTNFRVNLIPKITRGHVFFRSSFQKMKVKLATQIFSHSVYIALLVFCSLRKLPSNALHTASCIKDFNDFFDCFNSTQFRKDKFTLRYAISKSSEHISFLKDKIIKFFKNAAFIGVKRQPDCLQGCIITITALLSLVEDLAVNFDVKMLRTRFLNQDFLENSFSILRQRHGCNDNPTAKQIERGLRSMTLISLSKISNASNCEEEVEKAIIRFSNLPKVLTTMERQSTIDSTMTIPLDQELDIVEENALYYCCGFLTRKFLESHDCAECRRHLLVEPDQRMLRENYQLFIYLKAHSAALNCEFGHLYAPSYDTFDTLKKIDHVFNTVFITSSHEKRISSLITQTIEDHNLNLNLCSAESEAKFINLYVVRRIQWEVRFTNRKLFDENLERKQMKKLKKVTHE